MRILIVEDEENIQKILKYNLELEGYEVVAVSNGKSALDVICSQHFDVLLLDIMLPEINGIEICEKIRLTDKNVGIVMVSAKDTTSDKINGLKVGADDYITKPFNLEELLLRVKNVAMRSVEKRANTTTKFSFGDNFIDFDSYEAKGEHGTFKLTQKEVLLLKLLVERKNQVVSRRQILQSVWGYEVFPTTRTIDNFILAFRKHFEKDPKNPKYFKSIRGVGYKFEI